MSAPQAKAATVATDAVVIGAGPVGLFQVFQLGLLGLRAHVIDTLPYVGGQCVQLYADKPIYDIPGIACCTGLELASRLERQIAPFAPQLHLGQQVAQLQRHLEGGFTLQTDAGQTLVARSIFIAAGVGAFVPRPIALPDLEQHRGQQLHYHPDASQLAALCRAPHIVIHGGDTAAVEAALACAQNPDTHITLLHRRDVFDAAPAVLAQLAALRSQGRIHVHIGQICAQETQNGRLSALMLLTPEGQQQRLPVDQLLAYLGISPRLGPIAHWGLQLERKQLRVDSASQQTSEAGIYAVGDIVHYPGKRKLMVSGFHEAMLAAFAAAEWLAGHKIPLEYTSSSATLQRRLGLL